MSMSYSSLIASKATAGSIASWVNYSKLDVETILDEAQSLLFQTLRVREMRDEWVFGMAAKQANQPLPARFLDPIGRLFNITDNNWYRHRIETDIQEYRSYDTSISGDFAADPFTTTLNSSRVTVEEVAHDLTQDSTLTISGAATVGGLTLNGTFPVVSVTDDDHFIIDVDTDASSAATGGGAAATYTANRLVDGSPSLWSIWKEQLKFDTALTDPAQFKMLYYRAPKLLSDSNQSNWLTDRYPLLIRKACQVQAADFMKDNEEYQKHLSALGTLLQTTSAENDMIYRGSEFGTETP